MLGVLKGVQASVCGIKCNDLKNQATKILDVNFSSNQKLKREKKFYHIISNIQGILNLWRIRNLTLEGRIVVFNTLALSKKVFLALWTKIPYQVVKELEKTEKPFLWKKSTPKMKYETAWKDYQDVAIKKCWFLIQNRKSMVFLDKKVI